VNQFWYGCVVWSVDARWGLTKRFLKLRSGGAGRVGSGVVLMCYGFVVPLDEASLWIGEIEKHAGAFGRQTIFKDAMTTLSFRLEESLKEDVNLLAEYLTRRLEPKSGAGAVARAFSASGLEQMRAQYPDLRKFLEQRRIQK